ncbi:MAG: lysylphosphatidylglycerol synthase transmembrane domain-containing protein [Bacteroidota bacterium]
MKKKAVSLLKYLLSLFIAVSLLYYVFHDWDFSDIMNRFEQVNYWWVMLSVLLSIVSHVFRAYRWNILLEPLGYKGLSTYRTFKAVMIGYFTNLFAPRLGEVTRCGVLKRTDNVSMSASFGTVVADRLIDFLTLLTVILLGLIIEFDRLNTFFLDFINEKFEGIELTTTKMGVITLIGFIFVVGLAALWWFRERIKRKPLYYKIRSFIRELVSGFTSVLRLERRLGFWVSSISIWVLYYLMALVLFYSVESTQDLGLAAGLSILIMGGLGMSAPVQGGFGTYHILVGSILLTYGIAEKDGYFFATLIHTSQTIMVLIIGGISLLLTLPNSKKIDNN